jgi:hypothetical protein
MNETAAYIPDHFKTVKHVFDRAMRYQLGMAEDPSRAFGASFDTLKPLSAEQVLLTENLQNHLEAVFDGLRDNRWQTEPEAGNVAIKQFYVKLNQEMRRLGLL